MNLCRFESSTQECTIHLSSLDHHKNDDPKRGRQDDRLTVMSGSLKRCVIVTRDTQKLLVNEVQKIFLTTDYEFLI